VRTFLADGFRNVDAVADDDKIVRCLTFLDDLPDVRAYKERSIDTLRLRPDCCVADVACGLGFDLLRLHRRVPAGKVTGFDLSSDLVAAARRLVAGHDSIEVRQADAHAIDQPDSTFDAVRIDRSLQHLDDPDRVVAEMARITRPGGYVSASEPDWGTFRLTTSNAAGERLMAEWVAGFRNPGIGGALVDVLADNGLEIRDHFVQPLLLNKFEDANVVFDIQENARRCLERGIVGRDEADATLQILRAADEASRFWALLCIHTVTGRKL
jgi:ubiquinone/menaquinone biosynthesis C-methylase UbiE